MKLFCLLFLAAQSLHFDVTSATLEAGAPDADGWRPVRIAKAKGDPVLIWPFDGLAATPDGPGPIPALLMQHGDEKALRSKPAVAALLTPILLNTATLEDLAKKTGLPQEAIKAAFATLPQSTDPFEKGAGLLYANKPAEAAEQLATALKQRQRQLTRVPSEIYPLALLYGRALYQSKNYDDAAVAYLTALKQRPSDEATAQLRADALVKAGKPEAH
jgi:tetratricopeptide (TPR) repeat protein